MGDNDNPIDRLAQDARVERYARLESASEDSEAIYTRQENIARWMKAKAVSNGGLARMAGVSPGALSEVLRGKYKGDPEPILHKAEAAISEWYSRRSAPAGERFVLTRVAREVFAVVKATSKHRGIGVITGPSGVGKSKSLAAVVRVDFPSAVLVEVNAGCASPLQFLRALIARERMGARDVAARHAGRGATEGVYKRADAFNWIVARLAGSGRLIIVDEADNLRNETFNIIRQVHDAAGCPVVLAGRPLLHSRIERTMRDEAIGGSLVGRICIEHRLEPRAVGGSGDRWLFTVDEIAAFIEQYKVTYAADAARWLCALANIAGLEGQREGGSLRYAIKVLEMAITIGRGERITAAGLRQANALLRGQEWAAIADRVAQEWAAQTKAVG